MNLRLISPFLIFIVVFFAARQCGFPPYTDASGVTSIASTFAQIGASMLGFMLAAMAILATISDTNLVKVMKQQGHYSDLLKTLYFGCFIYLLMAIFGVALLFGAGYEKFLKYALLAISISALVSLVDLGHKFWLVLKNLHK